MNNDYQNEVGIHSENLIHNKIYIIRGYKVMIDKDLADLYGVLVKQLNQSVQRNIERFPKDFMFQLNREEYDFFLRSQIVTLEKNALASRSQFVTLNKRGKNIKYLPYAFTELGIAMLSSVLKSNRAISINIQIMRTFTKLREMLLNHKDLKEKIESFEAKYDGQFELLFRTVKELLEEKFEEVKPKEKIGFNI